MLGEQTVEVTAKEGKVSSWKSQSHEVSHDANTFTEGPCASCSCSSSEAWPVPKLSHFLASFSSWAISWAAADSSLHSCGLASLQQEPQRPKCPLGLSPESKVLPVSTTAFPHWDRQRKLFLDGHADWPGWITLEPCSNNHIWCLGHPRGTCIGYK